MMRSERPAVSVIVPFFGVSKFIGACVRSLMEQTLDSVEYIFVDDASMDDSRRIAEDIVAGYDRDVRIVTHPINRGLPAARNTGLALARGEFIFHCDSDDYLEPGMLELMYGKAVEDNADYVCCSFCLEFGDSHRDMTVPAYGSPEELIKEGFLAGMVKYNVWNKLVKKELYDSGRISFPEGHTMGEDMTMILLALKASRVACVPEVLYHYVRTNNASLTGELSERKLSDIRFNAERVLDALKDADFSGKEKYVSFFKLNVKLPLLFTGSREDCRKWRNWYPEADAYIGSNLVQPLRTRMVQKLASAGLVTPILVYSFLVDKLYYGGLFRR